MAEFSRACHRRRPSETLMPLTLYQKIWKDHVVSTRPDGTSLIWIDRHLIHEVTSPQAFEGLRAARRRAYRADLTLAVADHNVPTANRHLPIPDPASASQIAALERNCAEFGIEQIPMDAAEQGIVHVVGPEQGFTLPGLTIVCGDSHTSTHGALGALAFGIGTSEIEHVLATQTLLLRQSKAMEIRIDGSLDFGVRPKDVALAVIAAFGTAGATGHVIEYTGEVVRAMSVEGRMTLCNMAIEAGARAGLVAPDEVTYAYLQGRPRAPRGEEWARAVAFWRTLPSDPGARYDQSLRLNGSCVAPQVSWGTSPEDVVAISGTVPDPDSFAEPAKRAAVQRSLDYMGLKPGTRMDEIQIENVFIGSCTNSRIEDLRMVASFVKGKKKANDVEVWIVPGSKQVEAQAIEEGIDKIFEEAGFMLRQPGCSACLGMNEDKIPAGKYCISTSNRNFEGRQGAGARTLLASPLTAAAAAITGVITDVRELLN